jgi:hypothetical protein
LTARVRGCILDVMSRVLFVIALCCTAAVVALAQPSRASAGWCWPNCSTYGLLYVWTSSGNGCWYSGGEVCSGWSYWSLNGVSKTCYPGCDYWRQTPGQILYGFENSARIRGSLTRLPGTWFIHPSDVGMGGYIRAQVTEWQGTVSQINAAAAG